MNQFNITSEFIHQNSIKSNRIYGEAICTGGAIKIIKSKENEVEAWVGGLSGKVTEGGGSKRRVTFVNHDSDLQWHCTCNPKNHQIFCKHCVALAIYLLHEDQLDDKIKSSFVPTANHKFTAVDEKNINLNPEIQSYNDNLVEPDKEIFDLLAQIICTNLPEAEHKIWHKHPVWFLSGNPIVGYSKEKKV